MSSSRTRPWLTIALAALVLGLVAAASAQAKVVHLANGRFAGVLPKPSHAATTRSHARSNAKLSTDPLVLTTPRPGPLMLSSHVHLIFWGTFDASYEASMQQYVTDLAHDSGRYTNAFSVMTQYADANGDHITPDISFDAAGDVYDDTGAYPTSGCTTHNGNPCLSDAQMQAEVRKAVAAEGWPTDSSDSPTDQYIVFTPANVDSCMAPGTDGTSCTYTTADPPGGFCGYHSSITPSSGQALIYSNLPEEAGCNTYSQAPTGIGAVADGTVDTLIHELAESSTDPLGNGYADSSGNEIGDKCTGGTVTQQEGYGTPLGGTSPALFNQLINGHEYYAQNMWSNAAPKTPASATGNFCAQRGGPSPVFEPPSTVTAGQQAAFDGSQSYDINSTLTKYTWDWGDGSTSNGATATHGWTTDGNYTVKLTVGDSSGSTNYSTETRTVTVSPGAGHVMISQLRLDGTDGTDSFFELYNPSTSTVDIGGWILQPIDDNGAKTTAVTIPAGTSIAANGYYLLAGHTYSLASYAAADQALDASFAPASNSAIDLIDGNGVTADAVSFGSQPGEGSPLGNFTGASSSFGGQYAFVRLLHTGHGGTLGSTGTPQETNDNGADFALVRPENEPYAGTTDAGGSITSIEGAPGPHDSSSPEIVNPGIQLGLLSGSDPTAAPNRDYQSSTSASTNAPGTLYIRRTITNNTGQDMTRLRFRVSDITTGQTPAPAAGTAILRALSDSQTSVTSGGTAYTLTPMTLDSPSTDNADGGGLNASLTVPSISAANPLPNGASINVEFKLGVAQSGSFRFYFNTEDDLRPATHTSGGSTTTTVSAPASPPPAAATPAANPAVPTLAQILRLIEEIAHKQQRAAHHRAHHHRTAHAHHRQHRRASHGKGRSHHA